MLIDQVAPLFVADHSLLGKQLVVQWSSEGLASDSCDELFERTPLLLRVLPCFLDRMTNIWRFVSTATIVTGAVAITSQT
jgi:hypothetical protein